MNKLEKLNLLKIVKNTYDICRFYFKYDLNYWYFYVLDVSEKFVLGIEEDDFMLDGFQIRKISDIKKLEKRNDLTIEINKKHQILNNLIIPNLDLSSWKSIFVSLKKIDRYIIVENEDLDEEENDLAIGKIVEVNNSSITFRDFDADGIWSEKLTTIPFKWITSVTFNDRYSKTWESFLEENK